MNELIKKAKEIYLLSGEVYIFEDGNIFNNKEYAKLHAIDKGIEFTTVNLDEDNSKISEEKEISKPNKKK